MCDEHVKITVFLDNYSNIFKYIQIIKLQSSGFSLKRLPDSSNGILQDADLSFLYISVVLSLRLVDEFA